VADETKDRIERLLASEGLRVVFQPVVTLSSGEPIGYEALARFPDEGHRPAAAWFADAERTGMRSELEMAAVRAAVAAGGGLPRGRFLAFNISPRTAAERDLRVALAPLPLDEVVLDVNEDTAVDEYEKYGHAIEELRQDGVRVALDDAGVGFVSLRYVIDVRPDLIKIGIDICRNIDALVPNQALASAICAFAERMGARTVAEGVETAAELEQLLRLGVEAGQGYLFGRPQPAETFARSLPPENAVPVVPYVAQAIRT
jgi:EAL domain-containing protein (putative c-di-GMP-specific phosphodiesterase class I)